LVGGRGVLREIDGGLMVKRMGVDVRGMMSMVSVDGKSARVGRWLGMMGCGSMLVTAFVGVEAYQKSDVVS
jgi:hypothetical protein